MSASSMPPLPEEAEEVIRNAIRDLVERGNITVGITEEGQIGVWLWDQEPGRDPACFADDEYDDALYGAALKWKGI